MNLRLRTILATALLLATTSCRDDAKNALHPFSESTTQPPGEALRLQGRVNDAAGILRADVEAQLSTRLQSLEEKTGHQMVVVTTPSLGGETIELYTRALGNRWGIGRKNDNDGVVILVAPQERKTRIEVGRGLEKLLTNTVCAEVIQQDMLPHFRKGDFGAGLEAAVASLSVKLS